MKGMLTGIGGTFTGIGGIGSGGGGGHVPVSTRPFFPASRSIASSYPLQMLLYFNLYYSIVWVAGQIAIFDWKVNRGLEDPTFTAIVIAVWVITEPFRLSFGWAGNLQEKVPQLTAFFLLTIVPQIAIMLYMVAASRNVQVYEYTTSGIMLLFLLPEVFFSYYTTRTLVQIQTQRFYLQITNEHMDENDSFQETGNEEL